MTAETVQGGTSLPNTTALIERQVGSGVVCGMVAMLGIGDDPPRFVQAGTIAFDRAAPATPDTLWRIYSMTKPVTAAAAMILLDEGRIGLDDPVAHHLPEFARMRVLIDPERDLDSQPAANVLTIRHLLTHTSGMIYSPIGDGPLQRSYRAHGLVPLTMGEAFEREAKATRAPSLAEFARRAAAQPLLFEPGTAWAYGISTDVLGRVIEVTSGVGFDRFVETRIFSPLGMSSSFWTVPSSETYRFATNYRSAADHRVPIDTGTASAWLSPPSFPYGGGGLVMSAQDYELFLRMLQNSGVIGDVQVLQATTVALMLSNLLPPGVVFAGIDGVGERAAPGEPTGFGAGGSVYVSAAPGGFPGVGTYGWGGAAGSAAWIDPAHGTRGAVMLNVMGGVPGLREEAERALIADARLHLGRMLPASSENNFDAP